MSKEEILKKLFQNRSKIKGFGVKRIGLFGSYALGTPKKSSDIDFLVDFSNKTFDNYMGLKLFLEDQFKKNVDLVIPDTLKPQLKPLILKQVKYVKGI
jgi:predicted nucleotidyltransferase